jgi:hypothetical protein
VSYDHNDLYAAFEGGYHEGRQDREWHTEKSLSLTIRHEFEDWLHNHEAAHP